MIQKYQNEIAPIFYYGISTKTNEKDLKIHDLHALALGRIKKITLYNIYKHIYKHIYTHIYTQALLNIFNTSMTEPCYLMSDPANITVAAGH